MVSPAGLAPVVACWCADDLFRRVVGGVVADRLVVDLGSDGATGVLSWPNSGVPEKVPRSPFEWPLDGDALEDLRWYLEDYLSAPFGVWEDRGQAVQGKLAGWGDEVFGSVFGSGPACDAYQRALDKGLEVVFRSAEPALLALPWELMRDGAGPVALRAGGISRSLPVPDSAGMLEVPGGRLRVLMVISRPAGSSDVGYQMVARPLLERLDVVRGQVDLTVLRPPTFSALCEALEQAADAGEPFHVVHFDGHGVMPGRVIGSAIITSAGEGTLVFERPDGGGQHVAASKVAVALARGRVPVAVLNACQSGAIGKDLEASVATALLRAGCAAVVAMAFKVYAVAAAEFMAAFYEALFTGRSVGQAVTAGRQRLFEHDGRPSPRGDMPLADWLIPVHYMRKEVSFPQVRVARPAAAPSLDAALDDLRAPAPEPAAGTDPVAAVGAFVGRDDLLYQLEAASQLQRVVVLTGPGGTGKTELAKGFARWQRQTGGVDDPRLVLWHSFEPGLASFGLDGVINGIGLNLLGTDFTSLDQPQRLAQVKRLMQQHRMLLLWDNFETVNEMPDPTGVTPPLDEVGRAQLQDFLDWAQDHSRSTVIITSRAQEEWLYQVHRIEVGGLNPAEAAEYADRLLAPFPTAQARRQLRSFGELLEWLDGHPLAMRLTLPRLDNTEPGDLLAGLHGTAPMSAEVAEAGTGRLSSLGACVTYSFAHLNRETRRLLPAVSLFHSVADADVLARFSDREGTPFRFAGTSKQQWTAALEDAAQVGLLTRQGAGMYRIHPALPGYLVLGWRAEDPAGYGAEREACEDAMCAASADLSWSLTRQIESGDAAPAYAIIGLQRRTLGTMLQHALDRGMWREAEGIVRALDEYWDTRGLGTEAAGWADRVLNATTGPGQDTPVATRARSLWLYTTYHKASSQKDAGQPEDAARTSRRALSYLRDQPETEWTRRNIAGIYHQLGIVAQERGQLDEADEWYRKSLAIKEELGDRPGMAITYHQLGNAATDRGRLSEAGEWYRKSLAINEELGDRPGMASTYHQLGNIARRAERLDDADRWYGKSLAINEELGNRPGMASDYHQFGMTVQRRGRLDEADDWYRKSLAIKEELGDRTGMAITYHQLGVTAQARGRLDEADDWYRRAIQIREELGLRALVATGYHQLGMTARDRGRLDEADEWYRKSLAIEEELDNRPGMASTYHQLGILAKDRGRLDEADGWYRKSLAIKEELGDRPGMAGTYHQLGNIAHRRRRLNEADGWYRKSLAISQELGDRPTMASTYHQLGNADCLRGRLDEADGWYRKSLAINEKLRNRPGMALSYHQFGMTAKRRGRLDEADGWYRKSLAISQELGDRPGMAATYVQLGLVAEARRQPRQALEWNIRCVTVFAQFPHPMTGTGPSALARLTGQLGITALDQAWRQVTGQPVPQEVRDYIASHHTKNPEGSHDQPGSRRGSFRRRHPRA